MGYYMNMCAVMYCSLQKFESSSLTFVEKLGELEHFISLDGCLGSEGLHVYVYMDSGKKLWGYHFKLCILIDYVYLN